MADSATASATIPAERSVVYDILADVSSYPQWAKGTLEVEVLTAHADGRPETAKFLIDAGPAKDTYVLNYDWTPEGIRFSLVEPGEFVLGLTGGYEIAEAAGGTAVTYQITTDFKMPAVMSLLKKGLTKMIVNGNLKDLRKRVDA